MQLQPRPMGDFWSDLFSKAPQVTSSPEQRTIMARWPATAKTYRMGELIPFLSKVANEANLALNKAADVTGRKSVLGFGPSPELLDKIESIAVEIGRLTVKMAKRIQFVKAKSKQGFTAVTFPELRKDSFALMSLTNSLDVLVALEGGPSWIGKGLLAAVDAFTRTGAWLIDVGAKVAKPIFALLSNVDLVVWGGLGVLGYMWWKKRRQT